MRSKNFWIFGLKSSLGCPSNSKSKEKLLSFCFLAKAKFVIVLQLFKVKLMDGLAGTWFSFLPQYLTKAILLGALH